MYIYIYIIYEITIFGPKNPTQNEGFLPPTFGLQPLKLKVVGSQSCLGHQSSSGLLSSSEFFQLLIPPNLRWGVQNNPAWLF